MEAFTMLQKVVPVGATASGIDLAQMRDSFPYYYAFLMTYGYLFVTGFIGEKIKVSIHPEAGVKGLHYYPDQLRAFLIQQEKME